MELSNVLIFVGVAVSVLTVQCSPTTEPTFDALESNNNNVPPEEYDSVAYCDAYCDAYGYYQPGKWCVSQDSSVDVYCCGTEMTRYCCTDPDKDVGDQYTPAKHCPNSSWWYYQWKVIVGLLGTLVVMLVFAACCYYCCGGNRQGYGRARVGRFLSRGRTHPDEEQTPADNTFDPASPYAFRPPEYSLPKDPPKYNEIITGVDNAGFVTQEPNAEPNQNESLETADSTQTESSAVTSVTSVADNAPTSIVMSNSLEAPPVYEEIDSNQPSTVASIPNATSSNDIASVHVSSSTSGNASTTSSSSRHCSVTNHGPNSTPISSVSSSTDSLTSVENCLPPPYEEIPSTSRASPGNSPTITVSGVDTVVNEDETTGERL